jgi:hypothetical protein
VPLNDREEWRDALVHLSHFAVLIATVTDMLTKLAGLPHELTSLAGDYCEVAPVAA